MADVSRASFSIAYNGESRVDDHTMDIELLAPALMGIGKLIREANAEFNGKKAKANVRVVSDFEHKCFQINFDTVLTYYEQLKTFLDSSDVKTAKEVLEWIGIATGFTGISYFAYMKLRAGRKIVSQQQITDQTGEGMVALTFEGDQNAVHVHQHIYNLGENRKALNATRDAIAPIGSDGFTRIELKEDDQTEAIVDWNEAKAIIASVAAGIDSDQALEEEVPPKDTTAWLSVYSPVYDEKADKWRFTLGTDHIYADISETDIARDALARGGALVHDTYQVRLQITEPEDGKGKPTYKILEVLKFIPAERPPKQLDIEGIERE